MNDQLKILAVEDNPGDYTLLELSLKRSNYLAPHLIWVKSLNGALNQLQSQKVDIILLDLSLPDAWGIDAIKQLNSHASDIPIIVLTGNEDESIAIEAIEAGAQDYLVKGEFNSTLTMRAIRYAVARKRALLKNSYHLTRQQNSALCYNPVVKHTSDGILIIDKKGIIQFVNSGAAELYGQSSTTLTGTKFDYPLDTQEVMEIEFNQPTTSKQTIFTEVRIIEFNWHEEEAFLVSLRIISKRQNTNL
ncbi:MAG: response regulator [Anaerolineae bacterium]|nr:response regulator [Anaerolineae bacterium]